MKSSETLASDEQQPPAEEEDCVVEESIVSWTFPELSQTKVIAKLSDLMFNGDLANPALALDEGNYRFVGTKAHPDSGTMMFFREKSSGIKQQKSADNSEGQKNDHQVSGRPKEKETSPPSAAELPFKITEASNARFGVAYIGHCDQLVRFEIDSGTKTR